MSAKASAAAFFISAALWCAAPAARADMLGYWTFEEGTGTTALDSIGGHNGTSSFAPNGTITAHEWDLAKVDPAGPPQHLSGAVAPLAAVPFGSYDVVLTVFDDAGESGSSEPLRVLVPAMGGGDLQSLLQGKAGLLEIEEHLQTPAGQRVRRTSYGGFLGEVINRVIDRLLAPPGENIRGAQGNRGGYSP